MERRKQVRYPYEQLVRCYLPSAEGPAPDRVPAANISPVGMALRLRHDLKIGDRIHLELADARQQPLRSADLRVAHRTERGLDDWIVGGSFATELSAGELDAILPYSRPRVLLVESAPEIRRLLEMAFTLHVLVEAVKSGRQAIQAFQDRPAAFALVVMDVDLVDLDGVQTLAALRGIRRDVNCILLAGVGERYTLPELQRRGALAVMTKPLELARLIRAFSDLLPTLGLPGSHTTGP